MSTMDSAWSVYSYSGKPSTLRSAAGRCFAGAWTCPPHPAISTATTPTQARTRRNLARAVRLVKGRCRFLVERTLGPAPAPDGLSIIGVDGDRYVQHYFDSRGVARVYRMTFDGRLWTLERAEADFTPLDFSQRFTGTLDGDVIEGRWEMARDHVTWELDFTLTFRRK
jgi:hypothetical protein